jgi:hypothetical protein
MAKQSDRRSGRKSFALNKVAGLAALLWICSAVATAAENRVLVPIFISAPIPGAFGSVWTTELTARNDSDRGVEVGPLTGCAIPEGCGTFRPPHSTFRIGMSSLPNPNAGVFLRVDDPDAITFQLRVQDLSRQSETWGTSIPVVRERDVHTTPLRLIDIPVGSGFRSALRVYHFDPIQDLPQAAVRVRIYDMCGVGQFDHDCPTAPLAEAILVLKKESQIENNPNFPNFSMIGDLRAAFPQLGNVEPIDIPAVNYHRPAAVRLEIEPLTPNLRFWAFVSVTNNETQHVTVITPQ